MDVDTIAVTVEVQVLSVIVNLRVTDTQGLSLQEARPVF